MLGDDMPVPIEGQRDFWLFGSPLSHSLSPLAHNTVFEQLGLDATHRYRLHETSKFSDRSVQKLLRSPSFGGAAVTMPHKVEALKYMDSLSAEVKEIGSMNTVIVSGKVVEGGKERQKLEGRNTDVEGIKRALLATLPPEQQGKTKPFGEGRSAIIIGGGGTTRAAVYALSTLGLSPLWLINRDPKETAAIISTPSFAKYDLRALEREDKWTNEEADRVACGVGAIPSFEPVTEGEKNVYRLAEKVFSTSIEALVNQAFVQDVYWLALSPVTRVGGLQLQELKAAGEVAADRVRDAAVLFKLKPELSQEEKDSFLPICREGLAKVPYGTDQVMGPPIFDARAAGYEYGLYRKLKDVEEFHQYRACDEHMELINGVVKDRVADMVSFQIQG
ncbi:pentafunctional AROM polypeptide [Rhodotorula toruloides]|uniref:Pentafunctional AROM polypeptide n=1 Tax=Rhodotorula toruloides TaxID=5286 RepID=A0A511KQL9_RHOTO|nr:pentafunctional AROM polypeptide [Rhodotorula toruloides]